MIYFLQRLRRIFRIILGQEYFTVVDCQLVKKNFGSEFAGWDVAMDYINSESVVFSFGVGEDVSFDLELIEYFNLTVHAFDPTPKSIEWIDSQQLPANFVLHKYGLADFNGTVRFNSPENPAHVSYTMLNRPSRKSSSIDVLVKNISTIIKDIGHEKIDVMKMDIEGAEYAVINNLEMSGIRPKQLLVEFHHRFPGVGVRKTKEAVCKLRAMGYRLFCISSRGEEYSFIYQPGNKS